MRSLIQKVMNIRSELKLFKKRIKDDILLDVQNEINKIKGIVDSEINRRAENLGKQGNLN